MIKMRSVFAVMTLGFLGAYLAFAQNTMTFFITSAGPGNGANLGGLAGADKHCQSLAAAAGAGKRTWHAYLSTSTVNARDRIGPGPWRNAEGADAVRFDADRVAGRARLHFTRVSGGAGLPGGVLAKLAVRGLAPGTTLLRVTAGTASTPGGATAAPRVQSASLTVKRVS